VGFAQSSQKDWDEAIAANMMAPIFMIQAVLPGMRERKFGRIINITSAMVKSPSPIMCVSSAARAGVTALSKAVSKEAVMDNVTINNMLPEMFDTGRQRDNAELIMQLVMRRRGKNWSPGSPPGASANQRNLAITARFSAASKPAIYRARTFS
jgi:NAD(P)-dependent dehydrogenase (short-subunit alcohol dehydrogenase family)